jgi:uncharacterized protein YjcR
MTIPKEVRERARILYVLGGLTFERVAAELHIDVSTLKRWSKEEGWQEIKRFHNADSVESLKDFLEIRQSLSRLLRKAISREDGKLDKQGAGVSPKVLSAVARLAEVTALYFQPPAE